jgi:hypothetical protein
MQNSTIAPLVETISQQLQSLSEEELRTVQDFVEYLIWKHQTSTAQTPARKSAEARAMERIKDLDDPTQWTTVIEEGEEVDEEALNIWLKERGYKD